MRRLEVFLGSCGGGGGGADGRTIALDISDTRRRFLSMNDSSRCFLDRPRGLALFGRRRFRVDMCCSSVRPRTGTGVGF